MGHRRADTSARQNAGDSFVGQYHRWEHVGWHGIGFHGVVYIADSIDPHVVVCAPAVGFKEARALYTAAARDVSVRCYHTAELLCC